MTALVAPSPDELKTLRALPPRLRAAMAEAAGLQDPDASLDEQNDRQEQRAAAESYRGLPDEPKNLLPADVVGKSGLEQLVRDTAVPLGGVQAQASDNRLEVTWPTGERASITRNEGVGYRIEFQEGVGRAGVDVALDAKGRDGTLTGQKTELLAITPATARKLWASAVASTHERALVHSLVQEGLGQSIVRDRAALARSLTGSGIALPPFGGRPGAVSEMSLAVLDGSRPVEFLGRVIAEHGPWRVVSLDRSSVAALVHERVPGMKFAEPGANVHLHLGTDARTGVARYKAKHLTEAQYGVALADLLARSSQANVKEMLAKATAREMGEAMLTAPREVVAAFQEKVLADFSKHKTMGTRDLRELGTRLLAAPHKGTSALESVAVACRASELTKAREAKKETALSL